MANTGGIITTSFGHIKVEFYQQDAPKTVEKFKELARGVFTMF